MSAPLRAPETGDLWRLTMEHSPVGMTLVSPEGEFLTANNAFCEMLGYTADQIASMTFHVITHPDDLEIDLRLSQDALAGRVTSYRITKRYIRADGSVLVGDLSVALLRDERGTPIHFICQIADLSERRAFEARLESAEEAVEAERRKAEAVYATVAVGLLLLDAGGGYQAWNNRHQDFLDLAFPDGHNGQAGQDGFVYDSDQVRLLETEEMPSVRAASGEEFQDLLIWLGEDPPTRRALSVSARSVRDRRGDFAGAALAYHDVTELMRALAVKDDFVASVSHELRTPLTSALAYLELLDETGSLEPDVRSQVAAVRRNALRLSHLVADLLYTASATSGAPLVDPFQVDLAMVVREAVNSAQVDAGGNSVTLAADVPATLPVNVDGLRMRQVTDNLVANAIKYTQPGGRVDVTLAAVDDRVELVVADTGEGIEESDLDDIFTRFYRGENARRRMVPGTGLGLTIVKSIAEAHGGVVIVDSSPGVGTTVRVAVPV